MSFSRSLPELAHIISSRANTIYDTYDAEGIPQPSFDLGSSYYGGPFSPTLEDSRAQLLEALDELRSLILGPCGQIFFLSFTGPAWISTLHVLYKFELPKHVPLDGSISYSDLAARCGLSEAQTRRYIRAAISLRIFCEPAPNRVRHNAASAALATSTLHDWIGMATEDLGPASLQVAESMQRFPKTDNPAESAFALANGSKGDKDLFAIVSDQPERMERFANAMSWSMKVPGMEPGYTINNLGWPLEDTAEAGWCPKVVVDVGGGTGDLGKAILRRYPGVQKVVVEDLPDVCAQGQTSAPGDLKQRLQYQPYNFFEPQIVKDADVYIWRCVLHDWPDSFAIDILRNQIPALKPGARIILNERCLEPPKKFGHVSDQFAMSCDIIMQMCANAQERSLNDWTALVAAADKRLKIKAVNTPPHSALSIIEVVFDEDRETEITSAPAESVIPKFNNGVHNQQPSLRIPTSRDNPIDLINAPNGIEPFREEISLKKIWNPNDSEGDTAHASCGEDQEDFSVKPLSFPTYQPGAVVTKDRRQQNGDFQS